MASSMMFRPISAYFWSMISGGDMCRMCPAGIQASPKWPEKPHVLRLAPAGWKKQQTPTDQHAQPYEAEVVDSVSDKESALDVGETDRPGVRGRSVDLQPMELLYAAEGERKNSLDRLDGRQTRGLAYPAQIIGFPITSWIFTEYSTLDNLVLL